MAGAVDDSTINIVEVIIIIIITFTNRLARGGTVSRRTANNNLTKLYWTKALTKTTTFGAKNWTGAPLSPHFQISSAATAPRICNSYGGVQGKAKRRQERRWDKVASNLHQIVIRSK